MNRYQFKNCHILSVSKAALFGFGILSSGMAFSGSALAQVSNTETGDETRRLQSVTVSSTKREQTLQDVPVAVSVIDDTAIEKAEIQDLLDLQSLVPSLKINQRADASATNFFIRGFGNGALNPGIEPSVGVFIDGVYRSRSAAQISDLPNLERVEVLRGPQSTLFGKNASAGVVSIVTRAPQFDPAGSVAATVGNFNSVRLRGDVTGPLSEHVAFSLAGNFNKRDGFFDDIAQNSDINDRNRWGVRGELLIEPSETISFRIITDYDEIDETCCATTNLVTGPVGPVVALLGGMVAENEPFSDRVALDVDNENDIQNWGASVQADYNLSFGTLTSISAFRNHERAIRGDGDATASSLSEVFGDTNIDTFTQEIRLTSAADGPLTWMIGGYYFDETIELGTDIIYPADARQYLDILTGGGITAVEGLLGAPAGSFFADGQGQFIDFELDNRAWSVFGTLDFALTDQLTATLGLNHTSDEKEVRSTSLTTDVFSAIELPAPLAGLRGLQFFPPFLDVPNAVEGGKTSDDDLTYTLRLAYDMTDQVNIYGSYATGFKASSINLSRDARPTASDVMTLVSAGLATPNLSSGSRFADPEQSEVFELGLKAAFDSVSLNVAVFDQSIEDFQSSVFTGTGFALANAGKQSTRGVEIEATWLPTDNLTLSFGGTFLDAEYDSFEGASVTLGSELDLADGALDGAGDLSGRTPFGVPDVSTTSSANYEFSLNGWDWFVRGDWQYQTEIDLRDDPVQQAAIDDIPTEFNIINASLGFATEGGIGVSVWGRNILEEEFIFGAFPTTAQAGSFTGYRSSPATYGVTVKKTF